MRTRHIIAATLLFLSASIVNAAPITLDFEGIGEYAFADQFYNGGTDSQGNSGVNVGVSFTFGHGLLDTTNGGNSVANPPSGHTVLGLAINGTSVVFNVATGFTSGLEFMYSANSRPLTINIYDDIGGVGSLLSTLSITANHSSTPMYGVWNQATASFNGTAKSLVLTGDHANLAIDDLVLGAGSSVPEPSTFSLSLIAALAAFGNWSRIRRLG